MSFKKNNRFNFFAGLPLCLALVFGFSSCNEHDHETPVPSTGTLEMHLHTHAGPNLVETYGETYTLANGRKIKVDLAQLYISDVELIRPDGSVYALSEQVLLKEKETEEYVVGEVPVGNYVAVRFKAGLNSTLNQKTPTAADSALNHPEMWFGNSAQPEGYVFVNFQGSIDTTAAANGTNLIPFVYKIGTSDRLQTIRLPDNPFSITKGNKQYIHISVDYARLLKDLNLGLSSNLSVSTKAENALPVAVQVAGNIQEIFIAD